MTGAAFLLLSGVSQAACQARLFLGKVSSSGERALCGARAAASSNRLSPSLGLLKTSHLSG
jgi:hypothetical protein